MVKSRSRVRRRRTDRAVPRLEALECRTLFSVTPVSAVGFGSLMVDPTSANPSQILVRFRPGASPDPAAVLNGTSLGSALPLVGNLWAVHLAPEVSVQTALAAYQSNPAVEYAQPDFRVHIAGPVIPNDPQFSSLWGLNNTGQTGGTAGADIDAPSAWGITTGSPDTVIAVIDTGVDYNHPDLVGNIWVNADDPSTPQMEGEIPGNGRDDDNNGFIDDVHGYDFVNNDGDPMDDHFHGTHVAGTIAGRGDNGVGVTGVNWRGKIMALKFLDAGGGGYTSAAISAINYAVANGATISNNSWGGGGYDQGLFDAIQAAGQSGHIFVAAAGNNGVNNDSLASYPASYDLNNIISVAATDHNDGLAGFSNYGRASVDLGAPGVDVLSTTPGNTYSTYSGTSMATPHVAGVVGLLRSLHPDWSATQIIDQVLSSVDPIPSLDGRTVTGGRLNAARALGLDFGPRVVTHSPRGSTTSAVSSVQLTFSESITDGTFTTADIVSFTGPEGIDLTSTIIGLSGSGTTFTVSFMEQAALGAYSLVIGPDIRDANDNPMDQDRDGTTGESTEDRYTAAFTINDEMVFESTDVPLVILSPYSIVSRLTIDQHVTIADLNLQLDIDFPWVSDLTIGLLSPQGTRMTMVATPYVAGSDFDETIFDDQAATSIYTGAPPFRGSFQPLDPLAWVNGQDAFGTWELHISNMPWTGQFHDGQLNSWSLTVEPGGSPEQGPPDAVDDFAQSAQDGSVVITVLANDSDPDGDPLTVTSLTSPSMGSAYVNFDNSVTYTPNPGVSGTDSFQYTISDGRGGFDTATVTVTIGGSSTNHPPEGTDRTVTTSRNTPYTFRRADFGFTDPNDFPPNGLLAVYVTSLPADGDLVAFGELVQIGESIHWSSIDAGYLLFYPEPEATGTPYASFQFQVQDDGGGADLDPTPNTLTINVSDTPGGGGPVAIDDEYTTGEETELTVLAPGVMDNDYDPEGDPLTAVQVNGVTRGMLMFNSDGSFTYIPTFGYSGPDSFTYYVTDGVSISNIATVHLNVASVNRPPVANDDWFSTEEDTALTVFTPGVLGTDSDPDGDPLTATLVSGPAHGTLTLNPDGSFTYTPAANYYGGDSFTYVASDGSLSSDPATVHLSVSAVNDPPVANDQAVTTTEDTARAITLTGSDPEGDFLTYSIQIGPSHGTLSGTGANRVYTPSGNYNGPDSFTFQVSDGNGGTDTATVTITVTPVSDAPVAVNDSYSIAEGSTLTRAAPGVLGNDTDPDGTSLTAVLVSGPAHGTLTLNANGSFTYTPAADYTGSDSFTYQASDGSLSSNTATVSITIQNVDYYYFSPTTGGSVGGVTFTDSDIVQLTVTGGSSQLSLHFDGSDVGLGNTATQTAEDIDAFAFLPDGSILVSTLGAFSVSTTYASPGVGSGPILTGTGADLLQFWPTALGNHTRGAWEIYLRGSTVGLTDSGENIDAVAVLSDGRVVVSTTGSFAVPSAGGTLDGQDEDLLALSPDETWALYFDGSAVGLATSANEDVDAVFIRESQDEGGQPTLYLSTLGSFSVPGRSGAGEDVFAFHPTSLPPDPGGTAGSFESALNLDGSLYGLAPFGIDGFFLGTPPPLGVSGTSTSSVAPGGGSKGRSTPTAPLPTSSAAVPSSGSVTEQTAAPATTVADPLAVAPAPPTKPQAATPRTRGRQASDRAKSLDRIFGVWAKR